MYLEGPKGSFCGFGRGRCGAQLTTFRDMCARLGVTALFVVMDCLEKYSKKINLL